LDSVAFYSYVQHFVGGNPPMRPKERMWYSRKTLDGFSEVLNRCKPERILVLGKTTWRMMAGEVELPTSPPIIEPRFRLPETFCRGLDTDKECHAYRYNTGRATYALAAPIYHPAYRRAFINQIPTQSSNACSTSGGR
jgi:hypothetical protein